MQQVLQLLVAFSALCATVLADVYLHNPAGSNNRWNENGRARRNANRMFDSENNDRGGYNVRKLMYHVGSKLDLEWTTQHSCGNENNNCDVVIQYMCGDYVRDGTSTATIPAQPTNCIDLNCNTDLRYGMNEDFYYYQHCRFRQRDQRLYTADRRLKGNSAIYTRQNNNGQRFAYECTEERDYYPYWHPTPWKDIVVFTNNVSRCAYYQSESQNVKQRSYCKVDYEALYQGSVVANKDIEDLIPITKEECEAAEYEGAGGVTKNGEWVTVASHGIDEPDCLISPYGRDNHNGNGPGGQFHGYRWTVPDDINDNCVMRIRYNVSTGDFPRDGVSSEQNNRNKAISRGPDVRSMYGLGVDEGADRGYEVKGNPDVYPFDPEKYPNLKNFKLQHAINTAQWGRTFQDRTHTFAIKERPEGIPPNAEILNINVRGKRGNIVQTYPGVEYDFVPNAPEVGQNDYVHFQWGGSDNNPRNNDGQGRAGTDRSNVLLMDKTVFQEGDVNAADRYGALGRSYPEHINESYFMGLTNVDKLHLGLMGHGGGGDMTELNDAGTYYNAGPRKVTGTGTYHYMCTRNNNFSNRSQKGKIIVTPAVASASRTLDERGGEIAFMDPVMAMDKSVPRQPSAINAKSTAAGNHLSVKVPPNALVEKSLHLHVDETETTQCQEMVQCPQDAPISNIVNVYPQGPLPIADDKPLVMTMQVSNLDYLHEPVVYYTMDNGETWYRKDIDSIDGNTITFTTTDGASYIATKSLLVGTVAALSVGLIFGFLILIAVCVVYRKNKGLFNGYGNKI